jgi:hypothetical protein
MVGKNVSVFMVVSLVLSFSIISCKKSPTGVSFSDDDLVGKWIVTSMKAKVTMSGGGFSFAIDTTIQMESDDNYFQFFSNNTFTVTFDEEEIFGGGMMKRSAMPKILQSPGDSGTWSLSGNQLSMTSFGDDTTIVSSINISGNSLTMTIGPLRMVDEDGVMEMTETVFMTKQ